MALCGAPAPTCRTPRCSGKTVVLTLWGDNAAGPVADSLYEGVLLQVTACVVHDYNGASCDLPKGEGESNHPCSFLHPCSPGLAPGLMCPVSFLHHLHDSTAS